MKVPAWGLYMMLGSSTIGAVLLFKELKSRGFPSPLSK